MDGDEVHQEEEDLDLDDTELDDEPEVDDDPSSDAETGDDEPASEDDAPGGDEPGADADAADAGVPQLPEGFSSWPEFWQRYQQREQEYAQALPYAQWAQQQLAAQQAQQPQQPQGFQWKPPHELDDQLRTSLDLLSYDTQKFRELPVHLQQKALDFQGYVRGNWQRWEHNPGALFEDVFLPKIQPMFEEVRGALAEMQAIEFRRTHNELLADPENVQAYVELANQGVPQKYALELLRLRNKERQGQGQGKRASAEARDRAAQAKAARGRRAKDSRHKSRAGSPSLQIPTDKRANAGEIGRSVLRKFREEGEA